METRFFRSDIFKRNLKNGLRTRLAQEILTPTFRGRGRQPEFESSFPKNFLIFLSFVFALKYGSWTVDPKASLQPYKFITSLLRYSFQGKLTSPNLYLRMETMKAWPVFQILILSPCLLITSRGIMTV